MTRCTRSRGSQATSSRCAAQQARCVSLHLGEGSGLRERGGHDDVRTLAKEGGCEQDSPAREGAGGGVIGETGRGFCAGYRAMFVVDTLAELKRMITELLRLGSSYYKYRRLRLASFASCQKKHSTPLSHAGASSRPHPPPPPAPGPQLSSNPTTRDARGVREGGGVRRGRGGLSGEMRRSSDAGMLGEIGRGAPGRRGMSVKSGRGSGRRGLSCVDSPNTARARAASTHLETQIRTKKQVIHKAKYLPSPKTFTINNYKHQKHMNSKQAGKQARKHKQAKRETRAQKHTTIHQAPKNITSASHQQAKNITSASHQQAISNQTRSETSDKRQATSANYHRKANQPSNQAPKQ